MFAVVIAAVLAAATPVKLASPGWRAVNVTEEEAEFFVNHFAQRLSRHGQRVTTRSEMASLIGLERQRQLTGCSTDSSNCIAELAGALGVEGLILGNIAKFDQGFTIDIKVVSADTGEPLAQENGTATSSDGVLVWLRGAAPKIARRLQQKLRPGEPEPVVIEDAPPSPLRPAVLVPAAIGVAALGVGTFGFTQALSVRDAIRRGEGFDDANLDDSLTRLDQNVAKGELYQTIAYVGFGIGGAALVAAVAMHFLGVGGDDAIALLPSSDGGAFVLQLGF